MNNWIKTTIGAQITLQRGFDITRSEQRQGKIPVISSGGISSYHDASQLSGPGVILGRKGVVGSVYYVESEYWPHDTTLWVKDFHGNHPRFVYYFFKNFAPQLVKLDVGSANPTLNRNHVHPTETLWPPFPIQHAIARILGSIDDKIELNRQMNRTLEAIVKAIFKSWFVDFDPVREKSDGKEPIGTDAKTTALFPDEFEIVEGQTIPKGWNIEPLNESVDLVRGIEPGSDFYNTENKGRPFIRVGDLTGKRQSNIFTDISSDCQAQYGDVLISFDGTPGVVSYMMDGIYSTGIRKVKGKKDYIHNSYLWCIVTSGSFQQTLFEFTEGTTILHSSKAIPHFKLLVPDNDDVIRVFIKAIRPIWDRLINNEKECRTLAEIRDTLLPKLISGELNVEEVNGILQEN